MHTDCLQYNMTAEQRDQFDQEGYLIVPDALDESMLTQLLEAADRVDRDERVAALALGAKSSTFVSR